MFLIQQEFRWGEWESDTFVQCGVKAIQHADCCFTLSQEKYVDDLSFVNLRASRKRDPKAETDGWEKSQLRTLLGGVSWHAQQVAPHFSAEVGLLLSEVNTSTIDIVLRANKMLEQVKSMLSHSLKIHATPARELSLYAWVDAANANRRDGSSTQGILIGAASSKMSVGACTEDR